jgi:colanic acid/amylovoran biosynthesis glycosyltransferase
MIQSPSTSGKKSTPVVLMFRKRMLPYSETFIAAQGNHLPTWKAVYAGATEEGSGIHLLGGADACILERNISPWLRPLAVVGFKRFGRVPTSWLKALKSFHPSLLHVHFGPDALFMGLPLSKALGIPLVVTFHGFDITIDSPGSLYQKNRAKLFQQAARVIAVSDFIAGELERHGCPKEKIVRHYIGIDLELFRPISGLCGRKDVVFVGRLTEKKGCRHLIDAMLELRRQNITQRLHIIGDGGLREELEALAAPLGDQIVFHGRREPEFVREMVGRAAVFCAPSMTSRSGDAEGLGMVNLEAMALGTPVVSTWHTAIPEAVVHEETGILVPEADAVSLAAALLRCLQDEALARRMGEAGVAHVGRAFDIRKQCQSLEAIYQSVIDDQTVS